MNKCFRVVFILCVFLTYNKSNAQVDELLSSYNKIKSLQKEIKKEVKLVEVLNTVLEVNSVSNARFKSGKNRVGVNLDLPEGTTTWYYKITVIDLEDSFRVNSYNSLFYQLNNKKFSNNFRSKSTIDFYIIPESNIANFMQTGNDNYLVYSDYTKKNISEYTGSSEKYNDDFWIGIKNNNKFKGVKVILEIVALGIF